MQVKTWMMFLTIDQRGWKSPPRSHCGTSTQRPDQKRPINMVTVELRKNIVNLGLGSPAEDIPFNCVRNFTGNDGFFFVIGIDFIDEI